MEREEMEKLGMVEEVAFIRYERLPGKVKTKKRDSCSKK
jgi:hypothetical protein